MSERFCNALPTIVMVFVQFGFAGVNIFYKLAANNGMSLTIIIAYRLLFASAFIVPIAFFHERFHFPALSSAPFYFYFFSINYLTIIQFFMHSLVAEAEGQSSLGPFSSTLFSLDSLGKQPAYYIS